jgi:hypothetical protein
MTCARSCGVISQAHELSITLNRATLTQRGFARIVTSSAHLKDAADLKIHLGLDTNAGAEKDFLMIG